MNQVENRVNKGENKNMIKTIVTKEIQNLGMPANIKGYEYVIEAIMLVLEDRSNKECITKVLYPKIAEKFDTVATRVERAIRQAIEVTWDRGEIKDQPTNSEFIAMIADKIKLDMAMYEDCNAVNREEVTINSKKNLEINKEEINKEEINKEEINKEEINKEGRYKHMIKIIVTKEIQNLGMPANIKGYEYVREAIILALEDRHNMDSLSKILYPKIAEKFDTVVTRVERAIRHAIEVTWDRGNIEALEEIFKYTIRPDKGKATNSEFIAMIADKIRLDIEWNKGYGMD